MEPIKLECTNADCQVQTVTVSFVGALDAAEHTLSCPMCGDGLEPPKPAPFDVLGLDQDKA